MSINEKAGGSKPGNQDFPDDQTSKDLNSFVQNLLKQMQDRFEEMSGNITDRIDEMGNFLIIFYLIKFSMFLLGKKIDEIEKSVNDLMNDIGIEELEKSQD